MILFENPGEMDLLALHTHGLSVKEHDNPIGRFGTGLKYALAVLLREGAAVTVVSGNRWIDITSERREFRGKEFDFIVARPQSEPPFDIGFTTQLGRDWELWQAFRELYSNALDEHGEIKRHSGEPFKCQGRTMIFVAHHEIETLFDERGKIFLQSEPLWSNEDMAIHPGESRYVFYRGVRTMKLKAPSRHTYNLTGFQLLTEDRTFKYDFMIHDQIMTNLVECDDPAIVEAALNHGQGCYEHKMDYSSAAPSDGFVRAVADIKRRGDHNLSPGAESLAMRAPAKVDEHSGMDEDTKEAIRAASRLLEPLGIDVTQYPMAYCGRVEGSAKAGWAERGRIYLTEEAFKSQAALVGAMLRAVMGLESDYDKEDWLIRKIAAHLTTRGT